MLITSHSVHIFLQDLTLRKLMVFLRFCLLKSLPLVLGVSLLYCRACLAPRIPIIRQPCSTTSSLQELTPAVSTRLYASCFGNYDSPFGGFVFAMPISYLIQMKQSAGHVVSPLLSLRFTYQCRDRMRLLAIHSMPSKRPPENTQLRS